QGGTTATGTLNDGVVVANGGQVTSTGAAAITLTGTGGAGTGGNAGVLLSSGTVSASGSGTVAIVANSSGAANAPALNVASASSLRAASTADNLRLTSNNGATVAGTVTTPGGLLLTGTAAGDFTLNNAANNVARLAATVMGALVFVDSGSLTVGTV